MNSTEKLNIIADLSERSVYLIGGSFVLGSLFTLLLLLILDFVRHSKTTSNSED